MSGPQPAAASTRCPRRRANAPARGRPNASAGMPSIVGNTTAGHPRIAYDTRTASAGAGAPNVRLPPGGEANTCN